ncbi:hypothetical protein D3C72_1448860 [compost metagenome]
MLQLFECGAGVAFGQGFECFFFLGFGHDLVSGGHMFVEKLSHLAFGQRTHEAVHGLAVHEQHAGGNAANTEHARQLLLLIRIDLDQLETAVVGGLQLFEDRAQRLAGATPRRPEVHQHGDIHRGGNHLGFKVLYGDINHGGGPGADGACSRYFGPSKCPGAEKGGAKSKIAGSTYSGAGGLSPPTDTPTP